MLKPKLTYGFQLIYNDFDKESPTLYVSKKKILKNLKHVKCFLRLLIAAILDIIAVTTVAVVAEMALHKSVQTVHVVQNGIKMPMSFEPLNKTLMKKLASQVADLQQSVKDQLVSLQKTIETKM